MDGAIINYGIFGSIKSGYILRFIFSFLWENQKLDIISYNKQIQIKLEVNIDNYKAACKKENVVEKNGIVKLIRDPDKTTLTMITCTKDNDHAQTVYISELVG